MTGLDLRDGDSALDVVTEHVATLSAIVAPPGREAAMGRLVTQTLESLGLAVTRDRMGQLSVALGEGDGVDLMITAHLDEVGLVVANVDDDGFVRVLRVGGVPERVLPGTRVAFLTPSGSVEGVVGLKAHHLTPADEKYVALPAERLYVDVGAADRAAAEAKGVRVGTLATYAPTWTPLGPATFAGKALDDRLGVTALLLATARLVRATPGRRIVVGFTTQEEFHVRGTLALTARYAPKMLVNVDVSPATDTPDLRGSSPVRLGGGPVLRHLSFHGRGTLGGLIAPESMVDLVERCAAASGSGLQHEALIGLITDAAFTPMSTPEGVRAVEIGIPCRYTHSPVETGHAGDVAATARLIEAIATGVTESDLAV